MFPSSGSCAQKVVQYAAGLYSLDDAFVLLMDSGKEASESVGCYSKDIFYHSPSSEQSIIEDPFSLRQTSF